MIPLVYVLVLIPSAFAQTSEQIEDIVESGVDSMLDKLTDNIDLTEENFLNATEDETEELTESGKNMISEIFDLFFASHHFATSTVNWLSPYEIEGFVVWIIAGAIAVFFALSIMKRIALHIFIFIVVTLVIVAIAVYFYL